MNRKIPRCACSFECRLVLSDGSECPAYLVDISSNGGAVCPSNPEDMSKFSDGDVVSIKVDLQSVVEIDSMFKAVAIVRWCKGTLIGAEIIEIDTINFKKWLVLLYKSYFPV